MDVSRFRLDLDGQLSSRVQRTSQLLQLNADGTHAELLGFLPRARAAGHDIPYGRGGSLLATGLAGKDGRAAAAADSGYVFVYVCRAGGELVRLLLFRASDCGDLD